MSVFEGMIKFHKDGYFELLKLLDDQTEGIYNFTRYGCISLEEMYQQFSNRMKEEGVGVSSNGHIEALQAKIAKQEIDLKSLRHTRDIFEASVRDLLGVR